MPLLATNQRRPKAPIELGANRERVYFFLPSNPTDPGSVHVADVTEEDYDHLIKIEGYFAFRGTISAAAPRPAPDPAATTVETAAPAGGPAASDASASAARSEGGDTANTGGAQEASATEPPAGGAEAGSASGATDTTTDEMTPAEIETAALNVLELSWQRIQAEIDKGGIPTVVAQRALDIELAKPEADQKLTVIKKLRGALGVE